MIRTGRRLTAAEALSYGLVSRVVEAGAALDGARALAAGILDGSLQPRWRDQ
jgi:acetyl-CoA C-acetyltransferase